MEFAKTAKLKAGHIVFGTGGLRKEERSSWVREVVASREGVHHRLMVLYSIGVVGPI